MTSGGYLLIGRTAKMPVAFVAARDADPLRRALHAAFSTPAAGQASGPGIAGTPQ